MIYLKKGKEMKQLTLIKKRQILDKARREYYSFMSVRKLTDIKSSYNLLKTMLRLERILVKAYYSLYKPLKLI